MTPVRASAAAVAVMLSLVLSGCATEIQEVSVPSYAESKNELVALFDDTAQLVGGDWTIDAFEGGGVCFVSEGVSGRSWSAARSSPSEADPELVAAQVRADWEARGYAVEVRVTEGLGLHEVIVRGPYKFSASLMAGPALILLSGESACVEER